MAFPTKSSMFVTTIKNMTSASPGWSLDFDASNNKIALFTNNVPGTNQAYSDTTYGTGNWANT